ncbi:hypothetical protein LG329_17900 [Virgibacillus necropolis]|uniref:hypothetical protein n=1 Tax=Virgibacillus necropolis TaxID=163877 RepID=UPI00384B7275
MKTLVLTTAGAFLVAGGVIGTSNNTQADRTNQVTAKVEMTQTYHKSSEDISNLPESDALNDQVELADYETQVVGDNAHNRVILLIDENGQAQYKSILVKDANRLKIIDFDKGLVFNRILIDDQKDETEQEEENYSETTETEGDFLEFDILDEHVGADGYQTKIVVNNSQKRIIILNDENGQPQYKSIFVKETKSLEIIDLDQGMVFKGAIG